jgi:hypothetical protein
MTIAIRFSQNEAATDGIDLIFYTKEFETCRYFLIDDWEYIIQGLVL